MHGVHLRGKTMSTLESARPQSLGDVLDQPGVHPPQTHKPAKINISPTEREFSLIGGAGLVLFGLYRRSLGGLGLAALGAALVERGITGHCHGYQLLKIDTSQPRAADPEEYFEKGIHVEVALTIQRPPEELFKFWRNFENLPRFMQNLKSVQTLDAKRSRWVASGPAGTGVQWDAEIINEEPNALIAWRSVGNAEVDNAGSVRFVRMDNNRGTRVQVVMDYIPPAGTVGKWVAKLFHSAPDQTIKEDLRRFKALMESGEIPSTAGQPRGNCLGGGRRQMAT
jgi:uncharacterized membrane protein